MMTFRMRWTLVSVVLSAGVVGCGLPGHSAAPSSRTTPTRTVTVTAVPSDSSVVSSPAAAPSPSIATPSSAAPGVPVSSAGPLDWVTTPIMLNDQSLGTVSLPASWAVTPQVMDGGGSGAELTWAGPQGRDHVYVQISSSYGANHDVQDGSDRYDPSQSLPHFGCHITAWESRTYPFACAGSPGTAGFVQTSPVQQGAVVVWISGPQSTVLSRILNSVQLNA